MKNRKLKESLYLLDTTAGLLEVLRRLHNDFHSPKRTELYYSGVYDMIKTTQALLSEQGVAMNEIASLPLHTAEELEFWQLVLDNEKDFNHAIKPNYFAFNPGGVTKYFADQGYLYSRKQVLSFFKKPIYFKFDCYKTVSSAMTKKSVRCFVFTLN